RGDVLVVVKLHKQHTSVVMTVPKLICKALSLSAGDYVIMSDEFRKGTVVLSKFKREDIKNGSGKGNSDRKNKGRRT
ncbi:hypothetical protein LCGC14_2949310, partial [marine sediment metagenome]